MIFKDVVVIIYNYFSDIDQRSLASNTMLGGDYLTDPEKDYTFFLPVFDSSSPLLALDQRSRGTRVQESNKVFRCNF